MKLRPILFLAGAAAGLGPVYAQSTPPPANPSSNPSSNPSAKTVDPNEVICQKQEVLGSRLATKKVCMTRAQWADLKAQDRQDLERVQTNRGMRDH